MMGTSQKRYIAFSLTAIGNVLESGSGQNISHLKHPGHLLADTEIVDEILHDGRSNELTVKLHVV